MKKLILLLFLLPLFAEAQTYQSMPQAGYGPVKRMLFDSVLTLPLGITKLQNISGGRDVGQLRYNVLDSSLYTYSGSRWIKSGIDTSTIYYNLGLKLNKTDTAAMMTAAPRVQRFLDSVSNLKSSIAVKVNISDTANMMLAAPRVKRFLDSVTNLKTSIATKQNTITLTTTGTSGAATLLGATLNIPQYAGASQDLQSVTSVGASTTNTITIIDNVNTDIHSIISPSSILTGNDGAANYAAIMSDGYLRLAYNGYQGQLRNSNATSDIVLELPNKQIGSYTIATSVNGIETDINGEITIPTSSASENGILSSTDWNTFNAKIGASDTASMMAASPRIQRFLDSVTNLKTSINLKLNKSDTASMLTAYSRTTSTALKLNISDTGSMLTPYLKKVDTTAKFITSVFRKTASDSVFFVKGGTNTFAFKDSIGSGGGGGSTNIYNSDGSLTGARTVTLNSQPLYLAGGTTSTFFANGRVTIGGVADAGFKLDVVGGDARFNGVRVGTGVAGIASNTGLGNGVLGAITTGAGNTTVGNSAGAVITTGTNNTILGYLAGTALVDGSENVLIGSGGKALTSGGNNVMIGYNAGLVNTTGTKNTYVGWTAGRLGSQNTAIGAQCLSSVTGTGNTALGQFSGLGNTSGAGNIYLGFNAGTYATTQSNQIFISSFDNSNYSGDQTKSIIYGQQNTTTASQILTINGNLGVNNITPAATAVVDITSTTKGFLPPRMTTAQRTGISAPAEGLMVYDLTLHKLYVWDGTLWQAAF